MKWRALGLGLCSLVWLLGCAGTETGNPSFDGTVGYDAYSSQPGQVALRRGETSVVVDAVWLMLGDVQLGSKESCDDEAVVEVPGLGAGDHVGSQAPVTHVALQASRYCQASIGLQLADQPPSAAPEDLRGHSIVLSGTHERQAFRIRSALNERVTLKADAAEGFALDAELSGVLFGFDVAIWLRDLPWSQAVSSDGTLLIDAEHSPELLRVFEAQVETGIRLFADADRDGERDADGIPLAGAGVE